jgi:WD40-like Beta Propeller Repeat
MRYRMVYDFLKKNFRWYVLVLLMNVLNVSGQDKKLFSDAMSKFETEEYDKAFTLFQKILTKDSDNCNINYLTGLCLFNETPNKAKSVIYFQKAIKSVSKSYKESSYKEINAPIDALFYYAMVLQLNNRIKEAKDYFIQYQSQLDKKNIEKGIDLDQKIKSCDIAEEFQKKPVFYKSQLLPEPIKSKKSEDRAVFNANETSMVFESSRSGKPGLFYSQLKNGKWSNPVEITRDLDIDIKFDKFSLCSMSADGKRLYTLIRDEFESNLYVSTYGNNKWRNTKPLNRNINSTNLQTFASESPDGKQLYFTSNRKGGFGNLDIYVSTLNEKNDWGPAKNIGENINTPFNEETPFVSPDNNTLYFSSEGHNSMGGYDIFVSKRVSETEWGKPENIGYPINTTDDNLFFVPSKDNNKGYYAVNTEGEPHIALIDLNKKIEEPIAESQPKAETPVVLVTKPLTDTISKTTIDTLSKPIIKKTEKPEPKPEAKKETLFHSISGTISLSDNKPDLDNTWVIIKDNSNKTISSLKLSNSGSYKTQLKCGSYLFIFTAPGYKIFKKPVIIANDNSKDSIVNAILSPEIIVKENKKITEEPKIIKSNSVNNDHFTIQIAAFDKIVSLSAFKNIDDVGYYSCPDGLVRYYWGNFDTKTDAYSNLKNIINKGYKYAYVVPISKFKSDTINKISSGYTVQVFASFHEIDTSFFKSLSGFRMFKCNDRYIRYTSGKFGNYSEANNYLQVVIAKGFKDAFIRKLDMLSNN